MVRNNRNGRILEGSTNPAGYKLVRIKDDSGIVKTWGVHRLLGFVFIKENYSPEKVINHKDGRKWNNNLDNLEWVTYQENLEHAGKHGFTSKCIPVSIKSYSNGKVLEFPSAVECGRFLGITSDAVLWRIRKGEWIVYPEGYQFRIHSDEEWAEPRVVKSNRSSAKPVLLRDLVDLTVEKFDSLTEILGKYDFSLASLSLWINNPDQPVIPGYFLIKWEESEEEWREVEDMYLDLDKTTGQKSVVMVDDFTGEEIIYSSLTECANDIGEPKSNVAYWLKSNGSRVYKNRRFIYYSKWVHAEE